MTGYGWVMAVLELYYFEPKNAPNSEDDSSEDREVDNGLQIIHFADLVKDAKSIAGFSPSRKFRFGRNDVT